MHTSKGLIIYFDGADGAGKTTQLQLAAEKLRSSGHKVFETRTLGGTPIGEKLRDVVLGGDLRPPATDLHIALACHYALAPEILARRDSGEIVLVDRGPLSIIAFQVHGDGLNEQEGYQSTQKILDLVKPDLLISYEIADETLLQRRQTRHDPQHNYFEDKAVAYHQRVTGGYKAAAAHFKATVIDGNPDIEAVHRATMTKIQALFEP
jgi:dTMP kinase